MKGTVLKEKTALGRAAELARQAADLAQDEDMRALANLFGGEEAGFRGTTLPCGHFIPEGTFPLERYNGCPFCGTQFSTSNFVYHGQASKLKELRLFTPTDMEQVFLSLLGSTTPLDATQLDSLKLLLDEFEVPEAVEITMKETAMVVVMARPEMGFKLLKTPTDILRLSTSSLISSLASSVNSFFDTTVPSCGSSSSAV